MDWILRTVILINGIQLAPPDSIPFPDLATCQIALLRRGKDLLQYHLRLQIAGNALETIAACTRLGPVPGLNNVDDTPELTQLRLQSWTHN
jgi:hypothetical protein